MGRNRSQTRALRRQPHRLVPTLPQNSAAAHRVQRIPINEHVPLAHQASDGRTDGVSCHLLHPRAAGIYRDPSKRPLSQRHSALLDHLRHACLLAPILSKANRKVTRTKLRLPGIP